MNNHESIGNSHNPYNAQDKLKDGADKLKDQALEGGQEVWDKTKNAYKDVKNVAQDVYESGKKAIKDNVGDYASISADIEKYVSQNPVKTVLIGLGIFMLASKFMKE